MTTTVVTQQVTSSKTTTGGVNVITGTRDWNEGLFGCFSDCKSCLCGTFCGVCFAGCISTRIGENCCVPCFVPGGVISLRAKVRYMLGIQGSICDDCLILWCCGPCAICQMSRELDTAGWPQ